MQEDSGPTATGVLSEFIVLHRDEIIRRCVARVAARSVPAPPPPALEHGVPLFLEQLGTALTGRQSSTSEITASAERHGNALLAQGLTVSQVVHEYGDVCQSITELAVELNAPIGADDFRMLNGCLDGAIASAVSEYARQRASDQSDLMAAEAKASDERFGYLAHELRDLVHTSMLAFDAVKSGTVGVNGNTSRIIDRALLRARDLVSRSLTELRLSVGTVNPQQFKIAGFVDDLAEAGLLEANARGLTLNVARNAGEAEIQADRQVLSTAVMNVLQNAFKFTRPATAVLLSVGATANRILIEIQDQCGGLTDDKVLTVFRPFDQRHSNRAGLGLGLSFTQRIVNTMEGRVFVRNIPGVGCVFTLDLPRAPSPVAAVPSL